MSRKAESETIALERVRRRVITAFYTGWTDDEIRHPSCLMLKMRMTDEPQNGETRKTER